MKTFKRITPLVIGITLAISSIAVAAANTKYKLTKNTVNENIENTTSKSKILEIDKENKTLLISVLDEVNNSPQEILLKTYNDTAVDFDSLEVGDTIMATYSNAMTRSIPPQSNATQILKLEQSDNLDDITAAPMLPSKVQLNAVVKEVNNDDDYKSILVTDMNENNSEIVLNLDEDTIIADVNGNWINFEDLKEGDKLNIVHSQAMTMSLPPQTYSYSIIVNNDQVAFPHYIEVSKIEKLDDGTVKLTNEDGDLILSLTDETEVKIFNDKAKADSIQKGDIILAWFDIMTASIPSYATANKVAIWPQIVVCK